MAAQAVITLRIDLAPVLTFADRPKCRSFLRMVVRAAQRSALHATATQRVRHSDVLASSCTDLAERCCDEDMGVDRAAAVHDQAATSPADGSPRDRVASVR